MATRRAKHAGSWYSYNARELNEQLQGWLSDVNTVYGPARAIIAPHAGYVYCGSCGAYAYKQVDPARVKRVFILGPSHHVNLNGCDLTGCSYYSTPFYDLEVDKAVNDELWRTGHFDRMTKSTDENEHSIELHLPYIAKVMESKRDQFTIVPVLVGTLSPEKERIYGEIFSKYLLNPENLFVISSDFCHWGKRFRYHYRDSKYHHIYQSIEALDRKGMDHIERLDAAGFSSYIEKYSNTICGRYPIGVFLSTIRELKKLNGLTPKMSFNFLKYSQSNQCMTTDDTSVSYAAGVLLMS
ncbi:protein MEMO1 [Exaiptasia diaphana]|uniref:Protein MEMO1 n=1 Tax=Exaiptasia diaphana TaxID=2652724 RepID=A0A913WVZ4_EXADI|nr:protein MEMO1 [Exaiptasia diaphana]